MGIDFTQLDAHQTEIRQVVMEMARADEGKLFPLDLLAWAAANRAAALNKGFRALIESRNYTSAGALVRLQLDTALRFMAAWHVDDPHDFARRVIAGEHVRRIADRTGKRLTDSYLCTLAAEKAPWIPKVYEETSGFVHFSDKHLFAALESGSVDDRLALKLSSSDADAVVTDELRQEAIDGFCAAFDFLLDHLRGWTASKAARAEKA